MFFSRVPQLKTQFGSIELYKKRGPLYAAFRRMVKGCVEYLSWPLIEGEFNSASLATS